MTKIAEVLEKLNEARVIADRDLSGMPRQTLPGLEIQKAQAKREVRVLTNEYCSLVYPTVAKLFVRGTNEKVKEFVQLFSKTNPTVLVDSMYEYVASVVQPTLSKGETFSASATIRLKEITGTVCNSYGVVPQRNFNPPTSISINTPQQLTDIVRDTIRDAFGDSLNKAYITGNLVSSALTGQFAGEMLVLVVPGTTAEEQNSLTEVLFPGQPQFSLDLTDGEMPDKAMVARLYRQMTDSFIKQGKMTRPSRSISNVESTKE